MLKPCNFVKILKVGTIYCRFHLIKVPKKSLSAQQCTTLQGERVLLPKQNTSYMQDKLFSECNIRKLFLDLQDFGIFNVNSALLIFCQFSPMLLK